jgi:hypothetical protein
MPAAFATPSLTIYARLTTVPAKRINVGEPDRVVMRQVARSAEELDVLDRVVVRVLVPVMPMLSWTSASTLAITQFRKQLDRP